VNGPEVIAYVGDEPHESYVTVDGKVLIGLTSMSVQQEKSELPCLVLKLVGHKVEKAPKVSQ
jgi:hypothetical protein